MWNKSSKILILGAGPVGLSMGYQLWALGFKNVILVEKRKDYTREQIVVLSVPSWRLGFPKEVVNELFNHGACYSASSRFHAEPICFTLSENSIWAYPIIVKLNSLEKEMMNFMKKEVDIIIGNDIDLNDECVMVDDKKIQYDILIGADGSSSSVRKKWFKTIPVKVYPENKYTGVIVFYKPPKKMIQRFIVHNPEEDIRGSQFPRPQSRSRIFVLQDSTVMLSITLINGKTTDIDDLIQDTLTLYGLKTIKKYQTGEVIKFPLKFHKSSEYIKKNSAKKTIALIGDAAFNTHFFSGSGLNIGVTLATLLAIDPEKYNKSATDLQKFAEDLIKRNLINLKKLQKECKGYTREQLIDKLSSQNKWVKKERIKQLNKDELCLYLENFILYKSFIEFTKNMVPTINPVNYFTGLIKEDYCKGRIKKLRKKYNKMFDILLNVNQKNMDLHLNHWKSEITDLNPKKKPDPGSTDYKVWLAREDFKSSNPYKKAQERVKREIKKLKRYKLTSCFLLNKFKKDQTFDNLLNLYLLIH